MSRAIAPQLSLVLQGSTSKTKCGIVEFSEQLPPRTTSTLVPGLLAEASLDTNRAGLGMDDHCGQMWSVLTTNRHGMARLEQLRLAAGRGISCGFTFQWVGN